MTMPFGRYRGWCVQSLPDDYLGWLLTIDLHNPQLAFTVFTEWSRRRYPPTDLPADRIALVITRDELPLARRLFDAGRKALAKQCHPDRGGDAAEMARVNVLHDSLNTQLLLEDAA